MDWEGEYIGTFLIAASAVLALWARKRHFDRTNQFGIEQFSSFWGKLRSKMKDGLIGGASWVFLAAGLLVLIIRYQDSWGWVILLPASAALFFFLFLAS